MNLESEIRQLVISKRQPLCVRNETLVPATSSPKLLFPGAFNPLHAGHRQMAKLAKRIVGVEAHFELSVNNVDKAPLELEEIAARVAQFDEPMHLWLTCLPTFLEKAEHFPETTFIVGADTIVRISDARYYDDEQSRERASERIGELGCRFLVFGRLQGLEFQELTKTNISPQLRDLCSGVSEANFRRDISSTKTRRS